MTHRIAILANPGADLYGSDRMALETLSALASAGWRVIVTLPADGPLTAEIVARGGEVRICRTPVVRKSLKRPSGMARFITDLLRGVRPALRLIADVRPDLVVVNTITVPLWLVLARMTRRRIVCHVHEGEASASILLLRALNCPVLLAHKVIVNSEFSRSVLLRAIPQLRTRTTVIYNAVLAPEVRPARPALDGVCRLAFVGRLSARKGPDYGIKAVAMLRDRGVPVHLDLLGATVEGQESFGRHLRDLVHAAGLERLVSFHGFQSDVWPHLENSDVLLVPSTVDEPFGNTAVEAVLAARPAVVSRVGGLPEAVADCSSAILVRPCDPGGIADAVSEIAKDWDRFRAVAAEDAIRAKRRHSTSAYTQALLRVIDQACLNIGANL